ncbi:WecB/TagA/CpsF family glycosyltransferase [Phaeobacter gallaeciensis]|uniref:WecB/TagA/CpsF family glycosyltransferase n=1 Tax=Phaeobacter gallaeciensis TaxID=60890 RepID=UPI00237F0A72|nr:WecB/TagA/CpsF family glycosyltransferase [Phaeobacter gallaeciensis]MDE4189807.1 WecB/TagA/CpsF family glycosyltransferase [Phaeobacter gallaeciensis]MDE4198960.1 WecB/TagA/CpsF family glycosyltransferase [Phaeobacter gallaeciensis]MDE4203107.1 WecB/TagA/CpsF family glycosyltransferase [Phaeobacter gallaeciensis]MDE4207249.1 WecB/TagA/CpsF family glycosyltransferase [Phaeobacter gallaeciensis]MDE4215527.1 WecB/TagA/CpsF family glycosyltransferase [Phaeobacter gallaeciensis]
MYFEFQGTRIEVNIADRPRLESEVLLRFASGEGFALATVNLDHLVKLETSADFLAAYAAQDLVVADGRPVVWLSQLAGRPVELMPGSDMVLPLCRLAAKAGVPVALVGSTAEALSDASAALTAKVPGLDLAWCHAPSGVFDPAGPEAEEILRNLDQKGIRLCFLALGAPKQELLAARGRELAPGVGFASVGAGLDFLGGHQQRAPLWMRKLALEWLWRALSSPGRMVPRYLKCFAILPRQMRSALRIRRS